MLNVIVNFILDSVTSAKNEMAWHRTQKVPVLNLFTYLSFNTSVCWYFCRTDCFTYLKAENREAHLTWWCSFIRKQNKETKSTKSQNETLYSFKLMLKFHAAPPKTSQIKSSSHLVDACIRLICLRIIFSIVVFV